MTVKNILVAYSGWSSGQSPLKHALKIADHYDAWVTGIVGHGQSSMFRMFTGSVPAEIVDVMTKNEASEISSAKAIFEKAAADYGRADTAEIIDVLDDGGTTVASFARTFDLIVTAPHTKERTEAHMSANPDLIALQSGRPVLIVPKDYDASGLSAHVVVAWDGKRAAARAIGDAMSMLEEKAKVTVLTIGKDTPAGTDRLIQNLQRHGIVTELLQRPKSGSVGQTILDATQEINADLIVMGAYEHSKFAHDVFGGVTTDVSNNAKVPVFMAH